MDYVRKEGLEITKDPEKSYLSSFEEKVKRTVERKKSRFVNTAPRNIRGGALDEVPPEVPASPGAERLAKHLLLHC